MSCFRLIRLLQYITSLLLFLSLATSAQQEPTKFRFTWQTAHPNAKILMKDNFFWREGEEEAPFGSDAGSDAAYGFYKWRKDHRSQSPVDYLKELFASWKYPQLAWDELDTAKIKVFIGASALSYLLDQDEAIIGTAFAQIALEGKIDPAMKNYAQIALKREMLPVITRHFGDQGQQNAHNEKLTKLLIVIWKIHS